MEKSDDVRLVEVKQGGKVLCISIFFFDATDRGISMLPVAVVTTEGFVDLFFAGLSSSPLKKCLLYLLYG